MQGNKEVSLRKTTIADLELLFVFQLDPTAIHMAAFTAKDPSDKPAYMAKYAKLLEDPTINNYTILVQNEIAGSIAKFEIAGEAEITYWIDKQYWNRGIATFALQQFLTIENARPLFARTAFDNLASQKVLEKCGFIKVGTDKGFANARQAEIEELIFRLP